MTGIASCRDLRQYAAQFVAKAIAKHTPHAAQHSTYAADAKDWRPVPWGLL